MNAPRVLRRLRWWWITRGCECHWQEPYGEVLMAGCPRHDKPDEMAALCAIAEAVRAFLRDSDAEVLQYCEPSYVSTEPMRNAIACLGEVCSADT